MQPASVVIFLDELLQSSMQVFEVAVRAGVNLFALEIFRKLSQVALSYGFAGLLMLGNMR
jgi:hypothetical protein